MLEFLFYLKPYKAQPRVDSNNIDPPKSPAGKKAPRGFFRCAARRNPPAPTKNSSVFVMLEFLFYLKSYKAQPRVGSNNIDPPKSPAGKKAPAGLF